MPISLDPGGGGRTTSVDWSAIYSHDKGGETLSLKTPSRSTSQRVINLTNESKTTAKVGAFFEIYDPFWADLMEGLS